MQCNFVTQFLFTLKHKYKTKFCYLHLLHIGRMPAHFKCRMNNLNTFDLQMHTTRWSVGHQLHPVVRWCIIIFDPFGCTCTKFIKCYLTKDFVSFIRKSQSVSVREEDEINCCIFMENSTHSVVVIFEYF